MDLKKLFLTFVALLLLCVSAVAGPQTTSSSTGAQIIDRARVYLDETSEYRWTDTDLLRFLNDGLVDLVARAKCYQTTETINLVANQVEYAPTTEYIEIVAAVCNPASGTSWGLREGNVRSLGGNVTKEVPVFWYEFAGKVGIYPAYSTVTTETVTLYLIQYPSPILEGGAIPTPAIFDKALVYYIASQGFMLDRRIAEANNYMTLYLSEIDRFRKDFVNADNATTEPVR